MYINLFVQYDDWKMIGAVDSLSNFFYVHVPDQHEHDDQ